jgi:hypothetical protein
MIESGVARRLPALLNGVHSTHAAHWKSHANAHIIGIIAAGSRKPMTILCYSQRLLNPFRGSMCCIQYQSAEAVTADGIKWDIYVSNAGLLAGLPGNRRTQVSDIRYGTWSAQTGLKRGPLYPSDDFRAMEDMGAVVYEHLLKVQDTLPFPFLDSFELWLLDRQGRPLALLDSALTAENIDMRQAGAWNPGLACRKTFVSPAIRELGIDPAAAGASGDYLAGYINARAGESPAAQVFARGSDGSGTGLHGCNLDSAHSNRVLPPGAFPETLLDTRDHDTAHQELISDFIAWQAPWLLLLPTLDTETRRRYEQQARCQPVKLVQHHRLYPDIADSAVIDAARVEVRLRETVAEPRTEEQVLSTFYVELSPEVAD